MAEDTPPEMGQMPSPAWWADYRASDHLVPHSNGVPEVLDASARALLNRLQDPRTQQAENHLDPSVWRYVGLLGQGGGGVVTKWENVDTGEMLVHKRVLDDTDSDAGSDAESRAGTHPGPVERHIMELLGDPGPHVARLATVSTAQREYELR